MIELSQFWVLILLFCKQEFEIITQFIDYRETIHYMKKRLILILDVGQRYSIIGEH